MKNSKRTNSLPTDPVALAQYARRNYVMVRPPGFLRFVAVQVLACIGSSLCIASFGSVVLDRLEMPVIATLQFASIMVAAVFLAVPGFLVTRGKYKAVGWICGYLSVSILIGGISSVALLASGEMAGLGAVCLGSAISMFALGLTRSEPYRHYVIFMKTLYQYSAGVTSH